MNRASAQLKNSKKKNDSGSGSDTTVNFTAKVHETGATKQIDGQDAKETVMTLSMDASSTDGSNAKGSMAVTTDMWMIPNAPGYDEVRSFSARMAQELAVDLDAGSVTSRLNAQPGASQAMADLKKETAKMTGIPVLQTVRMGLTANGENTATGLGGHHGSESKRRSRRPTGGKLRKAVVGRPSCWAGCIGSCLRWVPLWFHDEAQVQGTMMQRPTVPTDKAETASSSPVLFETSIQRSNFSAESSRSGELPGAGRI